jgi:hypothetical protein
MRILRQRRPYGLSLLLAVTFLAMACSGGTRNNAPGPRSASSTTVTVAPGVAVVLPAGTDANLYRVSANAATPTPTASLNNMPLAVLMPLRDYTSASPVPAGTQLRFQTQAGLKDKVFEAYSDPATSRWVPEPTTYDPVTGVAIATVAHFSVHGLFTWSADRLAALLSGALKNVFGPVMLNLQPPSCGLEHGVAMSVNNATESVVSCHDATVTKPPAAGQPGVADIGVRIANVRNYPIDVVVPSTASVATDDPGSVAAQIGAAITAAVVNPPHTSRVLLPAGATAQIIIPGVSPPFAGLQVSTQLDGEAYLVGLLMTAIDEYSAFTYKSAQTLVKDLLTELSASKALERITNELSNADLSLDSAKTLGDVGLDALQVVLKETPGTLAAGVATLLVSLSGEVLQTVWGVIDNARGQSYHKFTFSAYGSTWTIPPSFARFAGTWSGHGRHVTIDASGHGEIAYRTYNPCPGAYAGAINDPAVPCESFPGDAGHASFQIQKVESSNTVRATTLSTNQPTEWGGGMEITWLNNAEPAGVTLAIVPSPGASDSSWTFCDQAAGNASKCGL